RSGRKRSSRPGQKEVGVPTRSVTVAPRDRLIAQVVGRKRPIGGSAADQGVRPPGMASKGLITGDQRGLVRCARLKGWGWPKAFSPSDSASLNTIFKTI